MALVPQLKRFITVKTYYIERRPEPGAELCFDTVLMKKWPKEMILNEELAGIARSIDAPNNLLTDIPAKIGIMTRLQRLNLRHNYVSKVPNSLCKLKELTFFDLSENKLKKLPNGLFKPPLAFVAAKGNRLKSIPKPLGNSKTLEKVDLSENNIRSVPKNMYKRPLVLDVSHNRIKTLPPVKVGGGGGKGLRGVEGG